MELEFNIKINFTGIVSAEDVQKNLIMIFRDAVFTFGIAPDGSGETTETVSISCITENVESAIIDYSDLW